VTLKTWGLPYPTLAAASHAMLRFMFPLWERAGTLEIEATFNHLAAGLIGLMFGRDSPVLDYEILHGGVSFHLVSSQYRFRIRVLNELLNDVQILNTSEQRSLLLHLPALHMPHDFLTTSYPSPTTNIHPNPTPNSTSHQSTHRPFRLHFRFSKFRTLSTPPARQTRPLLPLPLHPPPRPPSPRPLPHRPQAPPRRIPPTASKSAPRPAPRRRQSARGRNLRTHQHRLQNTAIPAAESAIFAFAAGDRCRGG